MAASDAHPAPLKNLAFRVTFPILNATGLVTGATGLDSEVSIDGGTFADCSNEATEIATSSGMYYLDLTAAEMNGDTIAVIVKTTTSGAFTTPLVFYPGVDASYRGSVTGATTTTTLIDSTLTQSGADHWKGRIVIFTSGALKYQASDITAFDPATDKITFTAMTAAASSGDTYLIV
jgi:hypothetical protein